MRAAYLEGVEIDSLFNAQTGHVEIKLRRLLNARMLWLNRRVMHRDPQYLRNCNQNEYEKHLISCCAFHIAEDADGFEIDTESNFAIADRYGGEGIGRNGGSGRAVFLNGYHVKGIGRTPLISHLTDLAHASGGAYLEECAREAIYSEIVDAEFPYGGIPVLAIIDTGLLQVWQTDDGPKTEKRCLLIRPAFIRPAHFMRAIDFLSENPLEGAADAFRVQRTINGACTYFGPDQFFTIWKNFWLRWAEQLAYAFVHRLNHGGNSESNISLDGRLLDFGAMTALPTWARITSILQGFPAGNDFIYLAKALRSAAPQLIAHINKNLTPNEYININMHLAAEHYQKIVVREILRLLGLTTSQAVKLMEMDCSKKMLISVNRLVAYFSREQFNIFKGIPQPSLRWDLMHFWDDRVPDYLREIRILVEDFLHITAPNIDLLGHIKLAVISRNRMRSVTRHFLFRDEIQKDLYVALDGSHQNNTLTQSYIENLIDDYVLRHRLDSSLELNHAKSVGFAISREACYALFENCSNGNLFGLQEWNIFDGKLKSINAVDIRNLNCDTMRFKLLV